MLSYSVAPIHSCHEGVSYSEQLLMGFFTTLFDILGENVILR